MKINMEFIQKEIENLYEDKIENMCYSEISEEVYEFLEDKKEIVCKSVYEVLANDECVVDDGIVSLTAKQGFSEDLILNWDVIDSLSGTERENEIQSTILYNYDALWMTAIQKAFPDKVTDIQCGYGEIDLL